ncbi:MAG: aminoglycoside phosphotransferase family protein [Candidatus Thorarchaeota archaeon]|jgi:aminoglycoside phosphotransferase (APT) family kinase protein
MTKQRLVKVHGHSLLELEGMLLESCDLFDKKVELDTESLGGWSNVNICGHSGELDFVLKLPWSVSSLDEGHYKKLYDTSLFFSNLGIASKPLALGCLTDSAQTPFILFEYVEGTIHESLSDFSSSEIVSLRKSLDILSKQKPSGLKQYDSPSKYLTDAINPVVDHAGFTDCSEELSQLITSYTKTHDTLLSYANSLDSWSSSIMHGDLWTPNILMKNGKVVLLDFEACAYGDRFFDLACLLEPFNNPPLSNHPRLVNSDELDDVDSLRPIANSYLITWSLERLLSMESGLVEPNLASTEVRSSLIEYINSKMIRLKSLLD